ncbi:MAG: coenzyme A pyrophosphatase [Pseudonocardiaceae bacterium]
MDDRRFAGLRGRRMSPPEEIRDALRWLRRRRVRRRGVTRAAVAVTVVAGAAGPAVLLTRHADALCGPLGELALPGGRADRWESAPSAARSRVAANLGIHLGPESVLGLLDDYLTPGRLAITPVVLWAGHIPEFLAQADLVAVPLPDLDVEPVFVGSSESDGPVIRLPLHGEWLHAPTAAVLHQFREVVLHGRRTRVAHLQQPELAHR